MATPTISAAEIAVQARLVNDAGNVPDSVRQVLEPITQAACSAVERFAEDAPLEIANLAASRLATFMFDNSESQDPLYQSGAEALLIPHRKPWVVT